MFDNMMKNNSGCVRLAQFFAVLFTLGLLLSTSPKAEAFTINEFPIPAALLPQGITAGPDGDLWFIDVHGNIGRMTTAGAVTVFPNPGSFGLTGQGITAGPDGNIWFTEWVVPDQFPFSNIGRITPDGTITKFGPFINRTLRGITAGPDGNLWAVDMYYTILRITPTGDIAAFPVPDMLGPGITSGPDNNIWFTEGDGPNLIGRITTAGAATEFTFNGYTGCLHLGTPEQTAVGPDGNIWFTERDGNKIGRITTDGLISEFMVPTAKSSPRGITAGPDGNVWFTESDGNKIGRITPAGIITEFTVPTAGSSPWGITAGPDGNIWFSEFSGGRIGQVVIAPPQAQIASIIKFFDSSVFSGTLTGLGPTPTAAKGRLGALRNMLVAASNLIDSGNIFGACQQLSNAYKKTDGISDPPNFVSGSAASQLASQIQSLMVSLGCQ